MKLAAIYNVWDFEHLDKSISLIYPYVEHVILVWQDTSNFGEHNPDTSLVIQNLVAKYPKATHLHYTPEIKRGGTRNETNKRNIGWAMAKSLGCSHFLFMDCDELYVPSEFEKAKQEFLDRKLDTSYCKMVTYWKEPIYRYEPLENYFVPFICSTNVQQIGNGFPVMVDPTRGAAPAGRCGEINIKMHHYSYVRQDIAQKLRNSSANTNWSWKVRTEQFNDWQFGQRHPFAGLNNNHRYEIVETKNLFL